MGLHLRLQQSQRQMQAQDCTVCGQIIDQVSQSQGEALHRKGLTGWSLCPCCKQLVEPPYTDAYKRRFVRWCIQHKIKPDGSGPKKK